MGAQVAFSVATGRDARGDGARAESDRGAERLRSAGSRGRRGRRRGDVVLLPAVEPVPRAAAVGRRAPARSRLVPAPVGRGRRSRCVPVHDAGRLRFRRWAAGHREPRETAGDHRDHGLHRGHRRGRVPGHRVPRRRGALRHLGFLGGVRGALRRRAPGGWFGYRLERDALGCARDRPAGRNPAGGRVRRHSRAVDADRHPLRVESRRGGIRHGRLRQDERVRQRGPHDAVRPDLAHRRLVRPRSRRGRDPRA